MKKMLLLLTLFLVGTNLKSQSVEFVNVTGSEKSVAPMIQDGQVQGYYSYMGYESLDEYLNSYKLSLYDVNLKLTHEIEMTKPKTAALTNVAFNGSHLCVSFSYLTAGGRVDNTIYTMEGVEVGEYHLVDKSDVHKVNGTFQAGGDAYEVNGKGFLVQGTAMSKKKGYKKTFAMFDNTGEEKWRTGSFLPVEGKSYEDGTVYYSGSEYIIAAISYRPKLMSPNGARMVTNIYSSDDGELVKQLELTNSQYYYAPFGAQYNEDSQTFILYGEYYGQRGSGTPNLKDKKGFFLKEYDITGREIKSANATFDDDIAPLAGMNGSGKMEGRASLFIHNIVKSDEGKYYVFGEQYKKTVSGAGIAANVLSGGGSASSMKLTIMNMVVFTFDSEMVLEAVDVIEKPKSPFYLPAGYGAVQVDKLAVLVKASGGFDYAFCVQSKDKSSFSVGYTSYNKGGENKDRRHSIGVITLDEDKELATALYDVDSQAVYYRPLPAKPGYIGVTQVYGKKMKNRRIVTKLEKLDI